MATLLLITIYIGFIGLGVPDSLLGSAWPSMFAELDLPLSFNGVFSLYVSTCTAVSSVLSARVIRRFGTGKVTAVSTAMTALALLGFALTPGAWFLFVACIPLGLGAGAVDAGLNNYVALHYKASHLNFLHCFYGVGVSVSPVLMSLALGKTASFRRGYLFAFFLQSAIALISFLALPLWNKVKHPDALLSDETETRLVPLKEQIKSPAVRILWLMFLFACAIEWTCGSWCATFLFKAKGLSEPKAALCVTLFYAGLAFGRFLAGVLSSRLTERQLIVAGFLLVAFSLVFMMCPAPFASPAFFFAGLGIGPVYPNLVHLTPRLVGVENSQSVMGTQMAAAYVGVMASPLFFGFFSDLCGMWILPVFVGVLLVPTAFCVKKLLSFPLDQERNGSL